MDLLLTSSRDIGETTYDNQSTRTGCQYTVDNSMSATLALTNDMHESLSNIFEVKDRRSVLL